MTLIITLFFSLVLILSYAKSKTEFRTRNLMEDTLGPKYKRFRPGISNLMM
ncbi:MAG: hypothetical protein IPN29_19640 [Saprospiraceae bacterium]|nr:hypothetical protein [Saprospiraceae bacterium]